MVVGGIHFHHFWYGIALLAIGGWLGISYNELRINRLAAVLFGAGGGLIGDEVGILLTFESKYYWAEPTYTFMIIFASFATVLVLLFRYSKALIREFFEFVNNNASLYFGIFLAAVSIAFLLDTTDIVIVTVSSALIALACFIILAHFIERFRNGRRGVHSISSSNV
jgi:hypothetical protein